MIESFEKIIYKEFNCTSAGNPLTSLFEYRYIRNLLAHFIKSSIQSK